MKSPDRFLLVTAGRQLRNRIGVIGFGLLLALWTVAFTASAISHGGPGGTRLGGDFATILGASNVLREGGNPYERAAVYRAEVNMLRSQRLAPPKYADFIRVGNPPVLFWALQPLTRLPFGVAAWLWIAAMEMLLIVGFLALLGAAGWRRRGLSTVVFLAMPPTMLAAYYGNVDGIVFASIASSLLFVNRFPVVGGVLLSLSFLKPQIAVGASICVLGCAAREPIRTAAGLAGALLLGTGVSVFAAGWTSLHAWGAALMGYSRELAVQPDIASVSGLYVYSASGAVRTAVESAVLATASALTVWWWRRRPPSQPVGPADAWLWVVWFLATPFAHFHDEVVLAVPVIALLGVDARRFVTGTGSFILCVLILSIFLFPTARFHMDLQSLPLMALAVYAYCLRESDSSEGDRAAQRGLPDGMRSGAEAAVAP